MSKTLKFCIFKCKKTLFNEKKFLNTFIQNKYNLYLIKKTDKLPNISILIILLFMIVKSTMLLYDVFFINNNTNIIINISYPISSFIITLLAFCLIITYYKLKKANIYLKFLLFKIIHYLLLFSLIFDSVHYQTFNASIKAYLSIILVVLGDNIMNFSLFYNNEFLYNNIKENRLYNNLSETSKIPLIYKYFNIYVLNCLLAYNSKLFFLITVTYINTIVLITMNNQYSIHLQMKLLMIFSFYLISFFCIKTKILIKGLLRKIFISSYNIKINYKYFSELLDNFNHSLVSIKNNKVMFCNKTFYSKFGKYNVNNSKSNNIFDTQNYNFNNIYKEKENNDKNSYQSIINYNNIYSNKYKIDRLFYIFKNLIQYNTNKNLYNNGGLTNSNKERNLYSVLLNKNLININNNNNNNNSKQLKNINLNYKLSEKKNFSNKGFEILGIFEFSDNSLNEFNTHLQYNVENIVKYYEVHIRRFRLLGQQSVDIIFNDITNIKNSENIKVESELKSTMFAKIAHEFKTPLMIIDSQLQELNVLINEENFINKDFCKQIKFNNNKLNTINNNNSYYNSFLDKNVLSKIKDTCRLISSLSSFTSFLIIDIINYSNSSKPTIKINKLYDIKLEIIDFTYKILQALITYFPGNKLNIMVVKNCNEETKNYYIKTDVVRLKQILLNIVSNAVKFTKAGNIEIKAEIIRKRTENFTTKEFIKNNINNLNANKNATDNFDMKSIDLNNSNVTNSIDISNSICDITLEDYLSIGILDTGKGMSKKCLNMLLNSNSDFINVNRNNYNTMGTGLGIGIIKNYCKLMGYSIDAKSISGKGTSFTILIPAYKKTKCKNTNISDELHSDNLKEESFDISKTIINNNIFLNDLSDFYNNNKILSKKSSFYNNYNLLSNTTQSVRFTKFKKQKTKNNVLSFDKNDREISGVKTINKYSCDNVINKLSYNNYKIFKNMLNININRYNFNHIENKYSNSNITSKKRNIALEYKILSSKKLTKFKNNTIKNKILICDDCLTLLKNLKTLLTSIKEINENYDIIVCMDGIEILNHIKNNDAEQTIKLVISDENMAVMNGSDAIEIIKKLQKGGKIINNDIKFINLTAFEDKYTISGIYKSGFDFVFSKPITKNKLKEFLIKFNYISIA